jgi:hypothetical protein
MNFELVNTKKDEKAVQFHLLLIYHNLQTTFESRQEYISAVLQVDFAGFP